MSAGRPTKPALGHILSLGLSFGGITGDNSSSVLFFCACSTCIIVVSFNFLEFEEFLIVNRFKVGMPMDYDCALIDFHLLLDDGNLLDRELNAT